MNYYALALKKILVSWYTFVAVILDLIAFLVAFYSILVLPPVLYISILALGFLVSCVTTVAQQLRVLDNSAPYVVANDNLSLGGLNLSVDSISLINVGGAVAKVTNITSDEAGQVRIIDDHYMQSFLLHPGAQPLNVMIRETKIVDGWGATIARPTSIVSDWKQPFLIYTWYQSLSGRQKFCTRIKFQPGERYVRNLGWERASVS